jgi:hypothetical protein
MAYSLVATATAAVTATGGLTVVLGDPMPTWAEVRQWSAVGHGRRRH